MSETVVQEEIKKKNKKDKKSKKDKKNKKDKKDKKGLFTYFKETKAELKRDSWASKSKTIKDSVIVIFAILLAVLFSLVIDSGISFFLKVLIK